MTPHLPEELSTRVSDWSPFGIMGNTMPPRDPDEDDEAEDEEEERKTTKRRTAPTNRRSCASRTKTKQDALGLA